TLRRWRASFDAAIADGHLPRRFDRGFQALWRYYLMYCEGGFRGGGIEVAQVTLVKQRYAADASRRCERACRALPKIGDVGQAPA
ncbi:hypothetical protein ABTK20_21770, partial [Acinetobacter baumannii]